MVLRWFETLKRRIKCPEMTMYVLSEDVQKANRTTITTNTSSSNNNLTVPKEDDEEAAAVDLIIPGLKQVCDSRYNVIGKVFWLVILLSFTGIMFIQVVDRIQYFVSSPVAVDIRFVNNRTLILPDVTICHNDFWNQDAYVRVQKEIANLTGLPVASVDKKTILKYMTYMDLYSRVAFKLDAIVVFCSIEHKDCSTVGKWHELISVLGICHTLKFDKRSNITGSLYGITMVLQTRPKKQDSWKVLIHDGPDVPKANLYTQGVSIAANTAVDIRMTLKQFNFQSTPSQPCSESYNYDVCFINCLSNAVFTRFRCRLPFMEDVDAPYCAPPDLDSATALIGNLIINKEEVVGCECLSNCNTNKFGYNVDTTPKSKSNESTVQLTRIRIYYENFHHQVVSEDFCYGIVPLLSDFGGSIGLFLGFSLLTLAEIGESLIVSFKKKFRKNHHIERNQAITSRNAVSDGCRDKKTLQIDTFM